MSILLQSIERSFEKYASKNALIYGTVQFTYEKISEAKDRFAQCLLDCGVTKGDRVAILLPNLAQFPISYYATLKIGAIAVPLNFLFSSHELQSHLDRVQPKVLVVWDKILPKVQKFIRSNEVSTIVLGDEVPSGSLDFTRLLAETEPLSLPPEVSDSDSAVIIFTPGNSSYPKAVELTHSALALNCQAFLKSFLLNSTETFIAAMPFFLIFSQVAILNAAFMSGSQMVLFPAFDKQSITSQIQKLESAVIVGNKAMIHSLFGSESADDLAKQIKYCIVYGEYEYNGRLSELIQIPDAKIFEGYGLCEATAFVTLNRSGLERRNGTVGLPIDNIFVRIVDDLGNIVGEGEIGEIIVQSPCLMKGYWGQPEETAKVIRDGWLYTGDVGKLDVDGYLQVLERKDNIILKDGFHVFPKEIEAHLKENAKIEEVSVIGIPDAVHGQEVKACVVLKNNVTMTASELIEYCQQELKLYKCPQNIQFYKNLPKSSTGRVLKYLLKEN